MKKISILYFFLGCLVGVAHSQTGITGSITDNKLNPINGVSVRLLNSNHGVISDAQGNFAIKDLPPGNYTLEFSAVGFASKNRNVNVGKVNAPVKISLEQTAKSLDEVVVTAEKR